MQLNLLINAKRWVRFVWFKTLMLQKALGLPKNTTTPFECTLSGVP